MLRVELCHCFSLFKLREPARGLSPAARAGCRAWRGSVGPRVPGFLRVAAQRERRDDDDRNVRRCAASARSWRVASRPDILGSWTSIRIRSGGSSSASRPRFRRRPPRRSWYVVSPAAGARSCGCTRCPRRKEWSFCSCSSPAPKGTVKWKVEPLPSSLSTQMRPPCISTNFLVMLRPETRAAELARDGGVDLAELGEHRCRAPPRECRCRCR